MERIDIRVPMDVYDALCREAVNTGKPLAVVIREALVQHTR